MHMGDCPIRVVGERIDALDRKRRPFHTAAADDMSEEEGRAARVAYDHIFRMIEPAG